tara:strand:- start:2609 stop:3010 length:402 start_codon:yes stop_codon:yes gene_type:complete
MIDMSNPAYVGFWKRLIAAILDSLVLGIPAGIIQTILVWLTGVGSLVYVVELLVLCVYIYFQGIKGGSPGKLILGYKVVTENGEYIGIPKAILRYIGSIISMMILGIGFLMIGWDARKQGLHDKIAKTYVVVG